MARRGRALTRDVNELLGELDDKPDEPAEATEPGKEENNASDMDIEELEMEETESDAPMPRKLGEGFYEVEAIRKRRVRKGKVQYLIKWKGWPESVNTWEPVEHLEQCQDIIEYFEARKTNSGRRKRGASNASSRKRKFPYSASDFGADRRTLICRQECEVAGKGSGAGSPAAEAAETLLNFPEEPEKVASEVTTGQDGTTSRLPSAATDNNTGGSGHPEEAADGPETTGSNKELMADNGIVNKQAAHDSSTGLECIREGGDTDISNMTLSTEKTDASEQNRTVHPAEGSPDGSTLLEKQPSEGAALETQGRGSRHTGAKKRKAGVVRRVSQCSETGKAAEDGHVFEDVKKTSDGGIIIRASAVPSSMAEKMQLMEYRSSFPSSDITKRAFASPERLPKASASVIQKAPIVKILKPIRYSSSINNEKQEVVVLFSTLRSDGKEMVVDNKFLRQHFPLLLLDFYEQHLRYTIK